MKFWLTGTAIFLGVVLTSCAGTPLTRIEDVKELPPEMTQAGAAKFEVKELAEETKPAEVKSDPKLDAKAAAKEALKQKKLAAALAAKKKKTKRGFNYPMRRPAKDPIWVGEELTYQIAYLRVQAGDLILRVQPYKEVNSRKVYHVQAQAQTSKVFSLFYRADDLVESFIDFDGIFSHRFHLVLDETIQTRNSLELNDSEKKTTTYWNRWNHKDKGKIETVETKPIESFPQDLLSSLYYLRTIPLRDGSTVEFKLVSEGKLETVVAKVIRHETLDTAVGSFKTIVLMPELKDKPKNGDSFIWLTDDERRIPLRVEAKVKVGAITMVIYKMELGHAPLETSEAPELEKIANPKISVSSRR